MRATLLAVLLLLAARRNLADDGGGDAAGEEASALAEETDDPTMLEGDMVVEHSRSGLIDEAKHWPEGKVYYEISSEYTRKQKRTIRAAMKHIASKSCIRFIKRTDEHNYIVFQNKKPGCFSHVGLARSGAQPQKINLSRNCLRSKGTPAHEMLHALGFYHEQSRPDRDDYIQVGWENIKEGKEHNFKKRPTTKVTTSGTEYDYASVMHYSRKAFSKNGGETLASKNGSKLGQRKGLSETDFAELNRLYKCGSRGMRRA